MHDYKKNWYISNINFGDVNSLFVYDEQDKKWYGTSPLLLIDVRHYITTTKKTNAEFDLDDNSPDGERAMILDIFTKVIINWLKH